MRPRTTHRAVQRGPPAQGFVLKEALTALATCAELPDGDDDAPALVAELARLEVEAVSAVWDSNEVDWTAFDLVVVRSAWDYAERREDFLAWARSLPRVLNSVSVLEWSTDKHYLTDLEQAGVPVVPTRFLEPGQPFEEPGGPFVVKPAVSAGGRSSARFRPGEVEAAQALVERIHAEGRTAMVQPCLGDVEETGLVYLGGSYSHALHRRVPLPWSGAGPGLSLDEELASREPTAAERAVADRALAAVGADLLYARVDVVEGAVLELEAAEPSLYLAYGDGAAARFAAAINQRLRIKPEKGRITSQ